MIDAIETTMDKAGRLVLPKAVREAAGFAPGMPLRVSVRDGRVEIEPAPREVRVVDRGAFRVAEPVREGDRLTKTDVRKVAQRLRGRRKRR